MRQDILVLKKGFSVNFGTHLNQDATKIHIIIEHKTGHYRLIMA